MRAGMLILLMLPCYAAFSGLAGVPTLLRCAAQLAHLLQDVTRPARGDRGTADGQFAARADAYVPGPPCCVRTSWSTRTSLTCHMPCTGAPYIPYQHRAPCGTPQVVHVAGPVLSVQQLILHRVWNDI